jgi:tetratricopeptide (TPR) repeat protein
MTAIAKTIQPTVTVTERERLRVAVPHLEEVAAQWPAVLIEDDKTWCCIGLGRFYKSLSLWVEAERCRKRALTISQTELGDRHPNTASTLFNLAALYYNTQQHQQARSFIQQALQIYIPTLGDDHPTTQAAYSWLQAIQQAIAP